MRPDDYLRNREQVAVRQQIVEAVADGLTAPETFLRAVSLYQGETRTVEYVTVPETVAGEIADQRTTSSPHGSRSARQPTRRLSSGRSPM